MRVMLIKRKILRFIIVLLVADRTVRDSTIPRLATKSPNANLTCGISRKARRHLGRYPPPYHSNPLRVSFRCSTSAIRKSDSNPSGRVLAKLMDPPETHRAG